MLEDIVTALRFVEAILLAVPLTIGYRSLRMSLDKARIDLENARVFMIKDNETQARQHYIEIPEQLNKCPSNVELGDD